VCERVGGKATLAGLIANLGGQYVVGLTATNCTTGDLLATVQARASNKAEVLKALDSSPPFCDPERSLHFPAGVLSGYEADPGGELPAIAERHKYESDNIWSHLATPLHRRPDVAQSARRSARRLTLR
jgi:hypothetical protein